MPSWNPRSIVGGRFRFGPAGLISLVAAFVQMSFVAAFHFVRDPWELLVSGAFGFILVMTTGYLMIAASSRTDWESTKNDRRS